MKKILVIGGTGTMGKPLVDALFKSGDELYVVCRQCISDPRPIKYFTGNAKDTKFMESVLGVKYDAIVDFCMYGANEFQNCFKPLLEATEHYICLSSAAVYADIQTPKNELSPRYMEVDPPAGEKSRWYCYEKARIEDTLIQSGYKNWTIVRPGMTMGPNHFFWGLWSEDEWIFRIIHHKHVIVPKDMLNYRASISCGSDITPMFLSIIGNKKALCEIYNVTSTDSFSWEEFLVVWKNIMKKKGYSIKIKYIDESSMLYSYPAWRGREYPYLRARLLDRVFDSSKIYSLVGKRIEGHIQEQLEKWIDEYMTTPHEINNINIASVANIDRITHEIAPPTFFAGRKCLLKYYFIRFIPSLFYFFRSIK